MKTTPKTTSTLNDVLGPSKTDAQRALSTVCIDDKQASAPLIIIKKLREAEMLAFLSNTDVSRPKKIAEIFRQNDPEILTSIAVGAIPMFARKNALIRIDEICEGEPLDETLVARLIPCLNKKELVAATVTLMDMSDFDWCPHCSEATVDALCGALYECQVIHESVILEDMFTHLGHRRHDLRRRMHSCDTGKFLMRTAYAPVTTNNIVFPDLPKRDNVA